MSLTFDEQLKFRLLAEGVVIEPAAGAAWANRFEGPISLEEYATTSGVTLELPNELFVNAPQTASSDAPRLRFGDERFLVSYAGREVEARAIPTPAYHRKQQRDLFNGIEQPYTNFGVTHTDRVRVSPISGCAWRCKFCDLPYEFKYRKRHPENLLEVIEAAVCDAAAPARHALISGGTPRAPIPARPGRPGSNDEAWLDSVFEFLAARSPLPIEVMMPPRRDLAHPEWMRSIGIRGLSINLEISDGDRAAQLAPAKARVGRAHTLRYIEQAVEAFGVGAVQSLVVFGRAIEPLESTLRGVRDLVERGCVPVLSPFRPHHLTPLADAPAASYAETIETFERTREICVAADTGVRPGPRCVPCHHNTATIPDGSSFYIGTHDETADLVCAAS